MMTNACVYAAAKQGSQEDVNDRANESQWKLDATCNRYFHSADGINTWAEGGWRSYSDNFSEANQVF